MSSEAAPAGHIAVNIKAPSDVKLQINVPEDATVADLKTLVAAANSDFPADAQRLIFSGKVLKDEDPVSKYNLKNGHTIHLVSLLLVSLRLAASQTVAEASSSEAVR